MPAATTDGSRSRMRSLLFAPANRLDLIEKLGRPGADAVAIDLEDGTPLTDKESARETAAAGAAALARSNIGSKVFVRTNTADSSLFDGDLEVVLSDGVDGLIVPKVESAAQLTAVERELTRRERRAGVPPRELVVGLETVAGVEHAAAILATSVRACAVYFGAEDFATDLGAERTEAGDEVLYARSRVAIAARLAHVAAVDQAVIEIRQDERFLADAQRGRELGYAGKLCVHPRQVELANQVFRPSPEDVERSRRLLEAYERALEQGRATAEFDGQMIDGPLVERARGIMARADTA